MVERCLEDYGWDDTTILNLEMERANMMAHLYSNPTLYEYTCMVTFAQHYVLSDQTIISKPLQTFLQQKSKQPASLPIFAGVVWEDFGGNNKKTVYCKNIATVAWTLSECIAT